MNKELGLQKEIPSFKIEEYGDKDTIANEISFSITEEMKPGNYTIQAIVSSYDTLTETAVLNIGECKREEIIDAEKQEIIKLNSPSRVSLTERNNDLYTSGIIVMAMLVVVAIIIMLILFTRR